MRRWVLVFIGAFGIIVIPGAALFARPQQQASVTPDRILKGTAPVVTITLDKSVPEVKSVRVAGQDAPVQQPLAEGKVSVQLPKLDVVGRADVVVIGKDDKPVAAGQLTYVESTEAPSTSPVLGSSNGLVLLLVYVGLIVVLPISCTIYDIHKSYKERTDVLKQLRPHATNEEIKGLLRDMDQGPTGLTGLTRGLIALTLILVLGIAAFHMVVFAPKVPDIADKLLTLLAGALTAITGFYFGSKASTEAAAAATASQTPPSAQKTQVSLTPKISKVNPSSASVNAPVTLIGEGFGAQQGKGMVTFGGNEATVKSWKNEQIEVTVPSGLPTGKPADIVVKNDNGNPSEAYSFQIDA